MDIVKTKETTEQAEFIKDIESILKDLKNVKKCGIKTFLETDEGKEMKKEIINKFYQSFKNVDKEDDLRFYTLYILAKMGISVPRLDEQNKDEIELNIKDYASTMTY